MSDVARAYVQMLTKSPDVPEHVIAGILATGADAIAPLAALLADRSLDADDVPSQGLARAHATELLGLSGEEEAIPPLLDALVVDRGYPKMVQAISQALARLHVSTEGGIVGPTLARVQASADVRDHMMMAMVLTSARIRDPRVVELLRVLLPQDPDIVLPMIATYEDPALAPDVARILLDAADSKPRVIQAVHTLGRLGVRHPKLDALSQTTDELIRYEVGKELLMSLAPHLAVLAR